MASKNTARLTDSEIDEEIVNEDLKHLGINDDLSNIDLREKKNLLSAIKQSADNSPSKLKTSPEKQDDTDTKSSSESPNNSPSIIDTDFPRLDKPKTTIQPFCLPYCEDDDAPPLILPEDCLIVLNYKKAQKKCAKDAAGYEQNVRIMLEEYESWRKSYEEVQALRQLKISQLSKVNVLEGDKEAEEKPQNTESIIYQYGSSPTTKVEEDIDAFISEESCTVVPKGSSQSQIIETSPKRKLPVKKTTNVEGLQNSEDDIFKTGPISPFPVENAFWTNVNSRSRNKQGRNKGNNKNSSAENEVDFNEKGNSQSGIWESSSVQKYTRRNMPRNQKNNSNINIKEKEILELKVQCPICQQDFLQSRIENHAAECDGFFSEPSDKPETRVSDNKDGSSGLSNELGQSNEPGPSRTSGSSRQRKGSNKRERDEEEEPTPKRFLRSND